MLRITKIPLDADGVFVCFARVFEDRKHQNEENSCGS